MNRCVPGTAFHRRAWFPCAMVPGWVSLIGSVWAATPLARGESAVAAESGRLTVSANDASVRNLLFEIGRARTLGAKLHAASVWSDPRHAHVARNISSRNVENPRDRQNEHAPTFPVITPSSSLRMPRECAQRRDVSTSAVPTPWRREFAMTKHPSITARGGICTGDGVRIPLRHARSRARAPAGESRCCPGVRSST